MVELQRLRPSAQTSKCQTNTFHQTRFFSCKTSPNPLPRNSSWLCFPSASLLYFILSCCLPRSCSRYPNLHEVRLIPTKRDIAFVEFLDEGSAGVAKDALHNYKLDGENKIKVIFIPEHMRFMLMSVFLDHVRKEVGIACNIIFLCSIINTPIIRNIRTAIQMKESLKKILCTHV